MGDGSNKWLRHIVLLSPVEGKEVADEHIQNHVLFLKELEDHEQLEVCGPFTDDKSGGMIILKNMSRQEADRISARDPFVIAGVRNAIIRTFNKSCWENSHLGRLSHD